VKAPALAEAAMDLPWLSPCAGSLAALVRLPAAAAWVAVRGDPGLVLLWARQAAPAGSVFPSFTSDTLQAPAILDHALQLVDQPAFVDWNQAGAVTVYRTSYAQATLAHALAGHVSGCDPDCAWIAGLMAPLGWLTACALDAQAVQACREHSEFSRNPSVAQQQCWGLDHTALVRRLCRRWKLPPWLTAVIGQLGLPAAIAQTLGADPRLLQVVQLAVLLVEEQGKGLGLFVGAHVADIVANLGLTNAILQERLHQSIRAGENYLPLLSCTSPSRTPLLRDYLQLARDQRSYEDKSLLEQVQAEADRLHRALEEQCAGEKERLRDLKLRALAEFAAGAGHEINNPLAVISGQAQYLLGQEVEPDRCQALQTIIAQTRRIHQVLTDLMQFARPKPAAREYLEVADLARDVVESLQSRADEAQVQLLCPELPALAGRLHVDPRQIRTILSALLRNAIEAAPADGWARLRVQPGNDGTVELVVEDNGAGPSPEAREHLFDPFYSGRAAGRGRGLGLTTAWRLAQLQGGHIRFDEQAHGLTRFVLQLPLTDSAKEMPLPEPLTITPPLATVA
jgi:signal transduction histidine kinase